MSWGPTSMSNVYVIWGVIDPQSHLKWLVIVMRSWISTGYFSNITYSFVSSGCFSPIRGAKGRNHESVRVPWDSSESIPWKLEIAFVWSCVFKCSVKAHTQKGSQSNAIILSSSHSRGSFYTLISYKTLWLGRFQDVAWSPGFVNLTQNL